VIDLHEGHYAQPEIVGVEVLLDGWLHAGFPDAELESHGIALFEGLFQTLTNRPPVNAQVRKRKRK